MAARRPFWKWRCWKSIGFCLWPPSTCIWNLKLEFQSKLDLCSGNHVVYRRTDGRTDGQGASNGIGTLPQGRCRASCEVHPWNVSITFNEPVHCHNRWYTSKAHLKFTSPEIWFITSIWVPQSFANFAQSTTLVLSCFVQNLKTIEHMRNKLCANEVPLHLS